MSADIASDRSNYHPFEATFQKGRLHRGFTLIEVLAVVGIIAVLIGFLIPAVQAAREAARRAWCASNLRQIGLALHAYNATYDTFPPAQMLTHREGSANHLSCFVYLLPYLEQQSTYAAINIDLALYYFERPDAPLIENRTARGTVLNTLLCPSDGGPDLGCSYRFNYGRRNPSGPTPYDGPFSIGVLPTQAAITDGLARTAFLSERLGGSRIDDPQDDARDIKIKPYPSLRYPSEDVYIPYCLSGPGEFWVVDAGRYWFFIGMSQTDYNHNGGPNDRRPSCGIANYGLYPPRSHHPGAVEVLFGDGHVEAIADGVDGRVWRALGTYNRGD